MVFGPVIHLQPNFMKARLNAFTGRNPDPGRVLRRKNNAISASRRFVLASPNNV
jgi:hypothetical protein